MLLVKFVVIMLLGFVIISLFTGLYFLVKDKGQSNRTVNALTVRIALSVIAIIIVVIAGATGMIETKPNPLARQTSAPADSQTVGDTDNSETPEKSIFNTGGRKRVDEGS